MTPNATVRRVLLPLVLVAAALSISGCGGGVDGIESLIATNSGSNPTDLPAGRRVVGKPYKAGGRWFTPQENPDYDETGKASWYGAELHGGRTANGERFQADLLTAAHPTLPLPSYIRVTIPKTGKSAVLRVNDRGPFSRGRLIDVSRGAAEKLGFRRIGHAVVRVEYLGPAELDGGDRETLVAEAKYGLTPDTGRSTLVASVGDDERKAGGFLPFGLGRRDDADEAGGPVEVRLASVTPEIVRQPAKPLPGVNYPTSYAMPEAEPAVASIALPSQEPGGTVAAGKGAPTGPVEQGATLASLQTGSASAAAQAYQDEDAAAMRALSSVAAEQAADSPPVPPSTGEATAEAIGDEATAPDAAAGTPAAASQAAPVPDPGVSRISSAFDSFASFERPGEASSEAAPGQ